MMPGSGLNQSGMMNGISSSSGASSSHHHNAIEPAEDDGIDDSLSSKQVSASRFNRNHRLLNEIFSEYCVPDGRSIITQQRMEQLKKQVHSLEMHHDKLKQELQLIEDKFETKKRKILQNSDDFYNELNKQKEFIITDEQKTQFFNKHYEQLQKQWKEHCDRFLVANSNKVIIFKK
jgi:SWI/SNF-related matrix-associated actin-dependent regulator of chromatin subfamily E protein 1